MVDNTKDDNSQTDATTQASQNTPQADNPVQETHDALSAQFEQKHSRNQSNPTYASVRRDAEYARAQIEGLNTVIAETTPAGPVDEAMKQNRTDMETAAQELQNGTEPTDVYGRYATASTTPPDPTKSQTVTHDQYSVSESGNNFSVEYDLTTRRTGGVATEMNNPNHILPATAHEQNYSYNEQTSGNRTTVTTSYTATGTSTPDSENIHIGKKNTYTFRTKTEGTYVYDKDKKLTSATTRRETQGTYPIKSDARMTAHKEKDISATENAAVKEHITIYANKKGTRFAYGKTKKTGEVEEALEGRIDTNPMPDKYKRYINYPLPEEQYTKLDGNKYTYVTRSVTQDGQNLYSGYTAQMVGPVRTLVPDKVQFRNERPMEPGEAEKQFKKLQKGANAYVRELTGANSMSEYSSQLGTPQKPHNLSAGFNNKSNADNAAQALQGNAELNAQYANTPTLQMNINGAETVIPSPTQTAVQAPAPTQPQTAAQAPAPAPTPADIMRLKQNQGR